MNQDQIQNTILKLTTIQAILHDINGILYDGGTGRNNVSSEVINSKLSNIIVNAQQAFAVTDPQVAQGGKKRKKKNTMKKKRAKKNQ